VLLRTWDRVKLFLRDAGGHRRHGRALNLLGSIGTDGSIGEADSDDSILAAGSRAATPLFAPMGIEEDNWPAVLGIVSGVLAKEVIVGTLDAVYGRSRPMRADPGRGRVPTRRGARRGRRHGAGEPRRRRLAV
jgi:ferrous iron transport protein B